MKSRIIYLMPEGRFAELNKKDKRLVFFLGLPLWVVIVVLLISSGIVHGSDMTIYNIISYTFLISVSFLLVYVAGLSRILKHKRLRIYTDGLVPSIIPFWDLTTRDVFVPYDKIVKIDLDEHPKFEDLYEFEIQHENGKVYKVNSKWLYQYKTPAGDVRRIKSYLLRIKKELEKDESIQKKREGKQIVLFETPESITRESH